MTFHWIRTSDTTPLWLAEALVLTRELGLDPQPVEGRARLSCRVYRGQPLIPGAFPHPFTWEVLSQPEPEPAPFELSLTRPIEAAVKLAPGAHSPPVHVVVPESALTAPRVLQAVAGSEGRHLELASLGRVLREMLRHPARYGTLVMPPACIEAVDSLGAAFSGGPGFVGAMSLVDDTWCVQVVSCGGEHQLPVRSSASPAGFFVALITLLSWQGDVENAQRLDRALRRSLADVFRAPDLGQKPSEPTMLQWLSSFYRAVSELETVSGVASSAAPAHPTQGQAA